MKKKIPSLIVERACDPGNAYFLSVLRYRDDDYLVIVDNITEDEIHAYVLDYAQQEGINLSEFMKIVKTWYDTSSQLVPLSFELSRLNLAAVTNRIFKTFELAHVIRLIGNDFRYPHYAAPRVRRRKITFVQKCIEVRPKATVRQLV
jgi:uncharacterized protein YqfB (UPF0267 family)